MHSLLDRIYYWYILYSDIFFIYTTSIYWLLAVNSKLHQLTIRRHLCTSLKTHQQSPLLFTDTYIIPFVEYMDYNMRWYKHVWFIGDSYLECLQFWVMEEWYTWDRTQLTQFILTSISQFIYPPLLVYTSTYEPCEVKDLSTLL